MSRSAIDDVEYDSYEVPASPLMELRMNDKKVSNLSFDLGLTVKDSLLSFTLANVGAGTLEASLSATGGYEVSPATLSVEGGQVQPFSVRQPADIPGTMSGTVTITAPDLEPISVSLRGIVRDPDKIYLNFDSLPQGWTLNEYGSLADSSLTASSWNDAVLTSPAVEVAEGEELFFRYTRTSDASYQKPTVTVAYSDDDENWTEMETNFADNAVYQQWSYAHISGIPTSARRIRLTMRYVVIDDLYGFSLPQKAIMQVTAADQDFGMIAADSARFFLVRNEGTAPLNDLKAVSSDPHFSVSLPESIAPGDSTMASLTLAAGESGLFSTLITVSATNQDTVSFRAEGYVVNQDALWLPLRDSLPDGWKNQGWELSDDGAHAGYGGQEASSRRASSSTATTLSFSGPHGSMKADGFASTCLPTAALLGRCSKNTAANSPTRPARSRSRIFLAATSCCASTATMPSSMVSTASTSTTMRRHSRSRRMVSRSAMVLSTISASSIILWNMSMS